ncbi:MAG: hypothetical protein QW563_05745 [Candidatus Methanomethylicia archaeon]
MRRTVLVATLSVLVVMAVIGSWALLAAQSNITSTTSSNELNITTPPICCRGIPLGKIRNWWGGIRVELSEEFKSKVTNIVKNDPDVQKLLDDGYNIVSIRPIFKVIIDANGNVVIKAVSANVLLQKNKVGCVLVQVDLEQNKVVNIIISTKTIIQK